MIILRNRMLFLLSIYHNGILSIYVISVFTVFENTLYSYLPWFTNNIFISIFIYLSFSLYTCLIFITQSISEYILLDFYCYLIREPWHM